MSDLSLSKKIIFLVGMAFLVPMAAVLVLSVGEMQSAQERQQRYALNQGFNHIVQSLEYKMTLLHNLSTMLAVNDMVNLNLSGGDQSLVQQILAFETLDSYTFGMEMAFGLGNILFYIDDDYPVINEISGRYRSLDAAKQTSWYGKLEENNGKPTWVIFSEDKYDRNQTWLAITRKLWNASDYSISNGVLAVMAERGIFEEALINTVEGQIVYLEAEDGSILVSNVPEEEVKRLTAAERVFVTEDFWNLQIDQEAFLVRSQMADDTGAYLISMLPASSVRHELLGVNLRMWLLYSLASLLAILALIPMTKSITKRLRLLQGQMLQIQESGEIRRIGLKRPGNDEIGKLITYYNLMTERVEGLMLKQYELGQEKMEAELKALQSQINPHFLYNTLDMINWMAQRKETDNICDAVLAMSTFYRMALSRGQDIIAISDEVRMCDAYMKIQQQQSGGRIQFEIDVDDDVQPYAIPKITLQPFIENAIIHGINEKEDERGLIILAGWLEDGRICLSVTDDGQGMQQDEPEKKASGSHYGMKNIEERLKLFFEEEIPIQIESSLGVGTCVIINIPAKKLPE
ncbi:MAG: sensor histidine kinase [Lachnospiraceae bacterium]|nr:sensor histidine kinase [Lachnospiraceae bacterium]